MPSKNAVKQSKVIAINMNINIFYKKINTVIINSNNKKDAINKLCKISFINKHDTIVFIDRKSAEKFYKMYHESE
jgi:hypothetical protein